MKKSNNYRVRFSASEHNRGFSVLQYRTREAAFEASKKYHLEVAKSLGWMRNQYRDMGDYYEVQVNGGGRVHIAKIDKEDLPKLQKCIWSARKVRSGSECYYLAHSPRSRLGLGGERFHRLIYPEWEEIDHINRDGLDNRRRNLRDSKFKNTNMRNLSKRRDNTSGKTGVTHHKYSNAWRVQWPEDGKRKMKQFGVKKYGHDEAKQMAVDFRKALDQRLGIENGYE